MRTRGVTTPIVVYQAATMASVRAPGGIGTDNYFLYWLNKDGGSAVGSLVRAPQNAPANSSGGSSTAQILASSGKRCYGLCMALSNIYYTDENNFHGVPRAATARDESVTVSDRMAEPRGCAYDGDGTVYIADKSANAVYQFPSNRLQANVSLTRAADMDGAYGVAVYTAQ